MQDQFSMFRAFVMIFIAIGVILVGVQMRTPSVPQVRYHICTLSVSTHASPQTKPLSSEPNNPKVSSKEDTVGDCNENPLTNR